MAERVQGFILVTLIAVMIWLAAEAESLGTSTFPARVAFAGLDIAGEGRLIVTPKDWDGTATLDLRGSRGALQGARSTLETRIELLPGVAGVPSDAGDHQIDLLPVLQQSEKLRASGITIESVSPRRVTVEIRELVVVRLPIRAELPGVILQGETAVAPELAAVRLPKSISQPLIDDPTLAQVIAQPTTQQLSTLGEAGLKSIPVTLVLPESLRAKPNIELLTRTATLTFTTQSGVRTENLSAPVWALTPSLEVGNWVVELDAGDQLLTVKVTGPNAIMDRLRSPSSGDRLVAVLDLSSDELDQRIESKTVGFALLRDGAPITLPDTLKIEPAAPRVRFTIRSERADTAEVPGGE